MKAVYVDTGAWIALIYRRDRAHDSVRESFARLREDGALLLTSDPAVSETVTRLRYDAGLSTALAFRRILDDAVRLQTLRIHESDADLRSEAFRIMEKFGDLKLSYADCIGAAVATKTKAEAVLGLDHDFRIMGFKVVP